MGEHTQGRLATAALAAFANDLRTRGVPVSTARFHAFVVALGELDIMRRDLVYWAGRCTLCSSPAHLDAYDVAFRSWFDRDHETGQELGSTPPEEHTLVAALEAPDPGLADAEVEPLKIPARSSAVELLRRRDLAELTEQERAEVDRLLRSLQLTTETKRTRRHDPARSGRLDRRATVRTALRSAGELRRLHRSRRRLRHRPVLLLIDVSGSMRSYASAYLRFAYAAVRRDDVPTEVFTLGTRLTRVTRELAGRDPEDAMRRATRAIDDWQGGTRLGRLLKELLDQWSQRGVARGAVAVVLSDGWERDDPELLGAQMGRLSRLAHRVIWANPRKARPDYTPLVGGMAASLPHVDHFVTADSLAALEGLARLVASEAHPRAERMPAAS